MTPDTKIAMTPDTKTADAPLTVTPAVLQQILERQAALEKHNASLEESLRALRPKTKEERDAEMRERSMPAPDGGPRSDAHLRLSQSVEFENTVLVRRRYRTSANDDGLAVIRTADFSPDLHERVNATEAPAAPKTAPVIEQPKLDRDALLKLSDAVLRQMPEARALVSLPKSKTDLVDAILLARPV
jgi:hypothetical protein